MYVNNLMSMLVNQGENKLKYMLYSKNSKSLTQYDLMADYASTQ